MDTKELLEKFEQLEGQVRLLTGVCADLRSQLRVAEREKGQLLGQIEKQNTELGKQAAEIKKLSKRGAERQNELGSLNKINKLVSLISADSQKTGEWKVILDAYIQELDKCIAYLKQ